MSSIIKPRPNILDLVPYIPGKPIEELERELGIKNAVKLASNENPLGPSPRALKAITENAALVNLYPDGDCFYLKRKIAQKMGVQKDNLIIGNGSNEVIELVARTFLDKNDEAIYGEHAFIVYPLVTQSIGANHVVSPMPDLVHDLKDMFSRITPKTRIIFIANPNNPTGTIVKKSDLDWFIKNVPEDIIIIVDEAYFEYVESDEYANSLDYLNLRDTLISVRTFSKIYGLAGLRVGYGIASKEIVSLVNRVREPFNVNSLAQVAAMEALDDIDHINGSKNNNDLGLSYLKEELGKLNIDYTDSHANFVLIDVKQDPMPIYSKLLNEGIIVRPVGGYGLKTHLRVSVGKDSENRKFINSLSKLLKA